LNDFLPPTERGRPLAYSFYTPVPVKEAIEGLGVPHTEVDLILVNGESVDFGWPLRDGDRVSVYPVFESIDISPVLRVRPKPLREIRFLADTHLGRLAAYLRLMGFDTVYGHHLGDRDLARLASAERRILLTRDRGLLMRSAVTHGYWLRQTNPRLQLREVLERFDLASLVAPFTRCLRCNTPLVAASKQEVAGRVPPGVDERHREFHRCPGCGRIYWDGSHYRRMSELIAATLSKSR
jgi:uncharacterized protein with PIN domain